MTAFVGGVLLLSFVSGCGLFKRNDATDPTLALARFLEPSSNLTRSSNGATLLRLQKLFPSAVGTGGEYRADDVLSAAEFNPRYATSLNRAFTAEGRPSSAVSMIGLRKWAASLCKEQAESMAAGAIFSREGVLLPGEAAPSQADEWFALSAARNVWLSPYKLDSPQVQTLLAAFREAKAGADSGGELIARQTVCMAALLAPEFWVGNPTPSEPLRRLALEVGRTVPTMADFDAYLSGKLSLARYVERLQTDPKFQPGYLAAVKEWHSEWWGLRDFLDKSLYGDRPSGGSFIDDSGFRIPAGEPRSHYSGIEQSFTALGVVTAYARRTLSDGNPIIAPTSATYGYEYNNADMAENCLAETAAGTPRVQAFDPRTTMLMFEHRHPTIPTRWEVVGAQVLDGYVPQFEAIVRAYNPAYMTQCVRQDVKYPLNWDGVKPHPLRRQLDGYPVYWECKGSVSRTGNAGFKTVDLRDFRHGTPSTTTNTDAATSKVRPYMYTPTYEAPDLTSSATTATQLVFNNDLMGTVHETWAGTDRRIRRQSPSGWQDGISEVKLWYTGSKAYACNALDRYWLTCAFRPGNATDYQWTNPSYMGSFFGGVNEFVHPDAFSSVASSANGHLLNQFRCGYARTDRLPAGGDLADFQRGLPARDEQYYPHGYDFGANYTVAGALVPAGLNPVINMTPEHLGKSFVSSSPIQREGGAAPTDPNSTPSILKHPELLATNRLALDLHNEPLNLLSHVVSQDLPYGELFTSKYSFGREELELFYRSQGLLMPAYPPGYTPPPADAPSRTSLKRIERSSFPAIPASWFHMNKDWSAIGGVYATDAYPFGLSPYHPVGTRAIRQAGAIPPLPSAGILSMPAFLGPVSQKMRTVSSRFFARLLCGEPNIFAPSVSQEALHRKYMSDPSNPAPAAHLKATSSCFSCHVNLDPLGAALSKNFLPFVQHKTDAYAEPKAMTGEFGILGGNYRGNLKMWLGARSGGEKGQGAFLGQPASGIAEVGAILAEADLMYSCTVNRSFQEVYGRAPAMNDIQVVRDVAKSFKKHRNFNRMLRELVTRPQFQEPN